MISFYSTFRFFQLVSSDVIVQNRRNNYIKAPFAKTIKLRGTFVSSLVISCTISSVTSKEVSRQQFDITQFNGSTRNLCLRHLKPPWEPFLYKRLQSKAVVFCFPVLQMPPRRQTWNDVLKINGIFIENPAHVFTCHHSKCGLA